MALLLVRGTASSSTSSSSLRAVTVNPARWERVAPRRLGPPRERVRASDTQLAELYRMDHPLSKGALRRRRRGPSERVTNYDATPHVAADARAYHFATPAVLERRRHLPRHGQFRASGENLRVNASLSRR